MDSSPSQLYLQVKNLISSNEKIFHEAVEEIHPSSHGNYYVHKNKRGHATGIYFPKNKNCKKNKCYQKFKICHSLYLGNLMTLYQEGCLNFFDFLSNNLNLNSLNQTNYKYIDSGIKIALEFKKSFPKIKDYFSDNSLNFLNSLLLSTNKNLDNFKLDIIVILFHFAPKKFITKKFKYDLFKILISLDSHLISSYFESYQKNFCLLVVKIISGLEIKVEDTNFETFMKFLIYFADKNIELLSKDLKNKCNTHNFFLYESFLKTIFDDNIVFWQYSGFSRIGSNILVKIGRELMKYSEYLKNQKFKNFLITLCSKISKQINYFIGFNNKKDYFKNFNSLGGVLLNQNKQFLLELIYFLQINNIKEILHSESINNILEYNSNIPEDVPDKYLDALTFEIMINPVQLSPSPEIVDASTYVYQDFTTGLNPFTRGQLVFCPCHELRDEITQWRNSISFSLDKKRNSYIGKFLHYYNEVIDLSPLFEN